MYTFHLEILSSNIAGKNGTLSTTVIREFERFCEMNPNLYEDCVNCSIKYQTFRLGLRNNMFIFDSVVKCMRLNEGDRSYVLPALHYLLEKKKHKEVEYNLWACKQKFWPSIVILP